MRRLLMRCGTMSVACMASMAARAPVPESVFWRSIAEFVLCHDPVGCQEVVGQQRWPAASIGGMSVEATGPTMLIRR